MSIEYVKKEGVRKALFDAVNNALWQAARCAEQGKQIQGGQFTAFRASVSEAMSNLKIAEELYAELLKAEAEVKAIGK